MKYVNFQIPENLVKEIMDYKLKRYPHIGLSAMFIELAKIAIIEDKRK